PFVSFVNFAHLRLSAGGGAGIGIAYVALGCAGVAAWSIGRWRLRLAAPSLGALSLCVVLVNTGYLGLPMTVALLGTRRLSQAVAYDQLISGPMLLIVGFGIGAAFGARAGDTGRERLKAFAARNPPLL